MSEGQSIREYARHRRAAGLKGGAPSAVHKAIKTGRICLNEHGLIDPIQADAAWESSTDATRGDGHPGPTVERRGPTSPPTAAPTSNAPSYATSRAIREAYSARLTKLSYEERSKILVDASRVQAEAFRRSRDARDALLAVPGRLAAILAAETDPAVVEARLNEELRMVLEVLADG